MAGHGEDTVQIFVTLRRGDEWPPATCDVRVTYDQTILDIKTAVSKQMGVPIEHQQLFWHKRELTAAYHARTLRQMELHTGFGLQGYDTRVEPVYWPPVAQTEEGLLVQ